MPLHLKPISKAGIPEAIAKVDLYRSLNEPEEAESICRDILAVEPAHQLALRLLGLTITDQFCGDVTERWGEAQESFDKLSDPYERTYYTGLLHERRAKAQLRAGRLRHTLTPLFEEAMTSEMPPVLGWTAASADSKRSVTSRCRARRERRSKTRRARGVRMSSTRTQAALGRKTRRTACV